MAEAASRYSSKARMEMFSDGVLAIAITLLIIDVRLPDEVRSGRLWHELGRLWPSYLAYAISFLTIGIMWVNHHAMMDFVERVDRGLLYGNLALLATIAFLPFPTAVLAEYIESGANAHAAAEFYGLAMVAIGACFTFVLWYLRNHMELMTVESTRSRVTKAMYRSGLAPLVYLAAVVLAIFAPYAAVGVYAGLALSFAFARTPEE